MNNSKSRGTFMPLFMISFFLIFSAVSCSEKERTTEQVEFDKVVVTTKHDAENNRHIFEMSTQEVSSGWVTIDFNNATSSDHFYMIYKVPDEGIMAAENSGEPLLEYWYEAITVPFQVNFNPYINGETNYSEFVDNLVADITENGSWFFDPGATTMGGPGFTAPARSHSASIFLEPGEYIVECYVKDQDQLFHSYIGMLEHLTVTDQKSDVTEPESDLKVTISSENGITVEGNLGTGAQTVEVFYEDQATYSHLLGHNVQLAKLRDKDDENLINALAGWMNWSTEEGLRVNAPEGVEFMGGMMEMTGGQTGYIHLNDLQAGDYAWIAEVPEPAEKGMLITFSVEE